jgi:hypothetical protein
MGLKGNSTGDPSSSSSRTRKTRHPDLPFPPPPVVPGLHLKTRYPYYPVPILIAKANETGDGEEARKVYKAFEDKRLYWKKTLKFWEDSRPAYEGELELVRLFRAGRQLTRSLFCSDRNLDETFSDGGTSNTVC